MHYHKSKQRSSPATAARAWKTPHTCYYPPVPQHLSHNICNSMASNPYLPLHSILPYPPTTNPGQQSAKSSTHNSTLGRHLVKPLAAFTLFGNSFRQLPHNKNFLLWVNPNLLFLPSDNDLRIPTSPHWRHMKTRRRPHPKPHKDKDDFVILASNLSWVA